MELTFEQARVLGALIEKQMTTPDYYPMTVNALVAACNQKNNRDPVTAFTAEDIERILGALNELDLARFTRQSGGRTLKYLHRGPQTLEVDDEQLALLAIMMLRGPQTIAELKTRTERYVDFASIEAVEERVQDLMTRDVQLCEQLPREVGQRETRFMTPLVPNHPASSINAELPIDARSSRAPMEAASHTPDALEQRVEALETTVAHLLDQLGIESPASTESEVAKDGYSSE